jgi:hypothetical protein
LKCLQVTSSTCGRPSRREPTGPGGKGRRLGAGKGRRLAVLASLSGRRGLVGGPGAGRPKGAALGI